MSRNKNKNNSSKKNKKNSNTNTGKLFNLDDSIISLLKDNSKWAFVSKSDGNNSNKDIMQNIKHVENYFNSLQFNNNTNSNTNTTTKIQAKETVIETNKDIGFQIEIDSESCDVNVVDTSQLPLDIDSMSVASSSKLSTSVVGEVEGATGIVIEL